MKTPKRKPAIHPALVAILIAFAMLSPALFGTPQVDETEPIEGTRFLALVVEVYDGDTFTAEVELGFGVKLRERFRLAKVDAPEVRGEGSAQGLIVRDYVRGTMLNKTVVLEMTGANGEAVKDKFGRWLAFVFVNTGREELEDLGSHLIQKEFATFYEEAQ